MQAFGVKLQPILRDMGMELEGWVKGEFFDGFAGPMIGLVKPILLCRKPVRSHSVSNASRKLFWFALVFSAISFAVLVIFWSVFALLCMIFILITRLFGFKFLANIAYDLIGFKIVFRVLMFIVPQCTILFLRYWACNDQEHVFLAALREGALGQNLSACKRTEDIVKALEVLPTETFMSWLRRYSLGFAKKLAIGCCVFTLSTAFGAKYWILPLGYLLKQSKISRVIGIIPALGLFIFSFLPTQISCDLVNYGLQILIVASSVWNEMLYTLLARCDRVQRRELLHRYNARTLGFGLAAGLLLSIPLVGPLLWFDLVKHAGDMFCTIVTSGSTDLFNLDVALNTYREEEAARKNRIEEAARKKQDEEVARKNRIEEAVRNKLVDGKRKVSQS